MKIKLPKQIIIIRHGEKPNDKDFFGLSQQGLARSKYLVDYFSNPIIIDGRQMFERPQMIFCFDVHDGINRSRQLMQPLIDTGIPFVDNINNGKNGTSELVDKIFDDEYENKTLLICWEHKIIPFMVNEIGKKLNNDKFNDFKFWAIDPKNGNKHKHDDELYSMTIIIDPLTKTNTLNCIDQSNDFGKNNAVLKKIKKYVVLFSL